MRRIVLLLLAIVVCCPAADEHLVPERRIRGNVITSDRDPALGIELPVAMKYVGSDRWTLYGVADCELHLFVEADEKAEIQSLYWVQFEQYIPARPDLRYNYNSGKQASLGGLDFDVRARFGSTDETPKPGSDGERVQALLLSKGYRLPADMMNVRFVHLPDDGKRKELMIIYAEDLKPTGLTANDLMPGAKASGQWPAIQEKLIGRARNGITIRR